MQKFLIEHNLKAIEEVVSNHIREKKNALKDYKVIYHMNDSKYVQRPQEDADIKEIQKNPTWIPRDPARPVTKISWSYI